MKVNWIHNGEGDFIARPDDKSTLHVELLDGDYWYWMAVYGDDFIACYNEGQRYGNTENDAKRLCMNAYKKLRSESNNV